MYITFEEYAQHHNDITEEQFARYCMQACKLADNQTTGVDGVRKLREYFPIDDDAEYVKLGIIEVTHYLYQAEQYAESAGVVNDNGVIRGRQVASVSSGSESISYTQGQSTYSLQGKEKDIYVAELIKSYFRGLYDSNGVGLLYMGGYPNV